MNKILKYTIIISALFSLFSCQKEEELRDESVIRYNKTLNTEFDQWIMENITTPYNVEVKYKWDDGEVSNEFTVTPPKIEKAKQFLEAYLNVWIKTYDDEAIAGGNPDFLKKYMPKQIILVGSPQFNDDGTMTLGLAEGGKKVTIFNIDGFAEVQRGYFDTDEQYLQKRKDAVVKAFHTLHHEFAHIMHQTKFYPDEFKQICKADYTATWTFYQEQDAEERGFITPYSMLDENEDFVEIVAGMLDYVKYSNEPYAYNINLYDDEGNVTTELGEVVMTEWEWYLYQWGWAYNDSWQMAQSDEAKAGYNKFLQKLDIVTTYYKEIWKIDLYNLQRRIETAVNSLEFN